MPQTDTCFAPPPAHRLEAESNALAIYSGHWIGFHGHWLILAYPDWVETTPTSLIKRLYQKQPIVAPQQNASWFPLDEGILYGIAPYETGIAYNWRQLNTTIPSNLPFYAAFTREAAIIDARGTIVERWGQHPEFMQLLDHVVDTLTKSAPSPRPHTLFHCSDFTPDWSYRAYSSAFERAMQYIQAGDCYQVNLAQRFQAHFSGSSLAAFFRLMQPSPPPYAGYLQTPAATILSCSPEHFISCNDKHLRTDPIKGTRPRHNDPATDAQLRHELISSTKDKAENVMIVDLLRNDLGRLAVPGSVCVPELFRLESFQNVHHLVSTVEARLRPSIHPMQALLSCLPGGSITGAPKKRAIEIIAELEGSHRESYCGSQFLASPTQLVSNITIRTLQLEGNTLTLWGGGGIVADSECRAEYNESLIKINHIATALGSTPIPLR